MAKAPAPIQTRSFKRGETILTATTRPTHVFLVQSGLISICILKDGCTPLYFIGAGQCLREDALIGGAPTGVSAIAVKDTEVLEIPLETARSQIDGSGLTVYPIIKGLLERLKISLSELRGIKVARHARPCPSDVIAKLFGVIFHTAQYVGKKEGDVVLVEWDAFRAYATEVFLEDPIRLEEGIHVLTNLGYAVPVRESEYDTDWKAIRFTNMIQVEKFFDFYQNYQFKTGHAGMLKTDDKTTEVTEHLVRIADTYRTDRTGMVTLPYKATVDAMKEVFGKTFDGEQIIRLEQKGLMMKRVSTSDGGRLSFIKSEFEQMLLNWQVLKEVERWNTNGLVELEPARPETLDAAPVQTAAEEKREGSAIDAWSPMVLSGKPIKIRTHPAQPHETLCPNCMSTLRKEQTYCPVCDTDLKKKNAA